MREHKPGMYFITVGGINRATFPSEYIKSDTLSSSPQDALIKYMHSQYDTYVDSNRSFIVSNKYSPNIYNYRINIYRIDGQYLNFLNKYPDTSQAIYAKVTDETNIYDMVTEVNPDKAVFLMEYISSYGMNIITVDSDHLLEVSMKQSNIAISKIDEFVGDISPDESFIRSVPIPEKIINPVNWSHSIVVGEYDISETTSIDQSDTKDILYNLRQFITTDISKDYYVEISNISGGYGIIKLIRKDIVQEHDDVSQIGRNLWSTMLESGDGFCGINYNIRDMYYGNVVECVDLTSAIRSVPRREVLSESRSVYGGEYSPIYIVLTDTGTVAGKIIKRVTSSPYNHVSLSLDPELKTMYSFSPISEFKKSGFTVESISKSYLDKYDKVNSQVYAVFVNQEQFRKVNMYISSILSSYKNAGYNFIGILGYILNKPMERENKKFCSEFVDEIFKLIDMDITHKKSGLVKPYDFGNSSVSTIFKVYEGQLSDINVNRINTTLTTIFKNNKDIISEDTFIYNEAKSFPVQFDKDGNMFIKNMKKLDYQSEYEDSHRLLGLYEKGKNIEGIKFELSKMWFLNSLIEEELYSRKRPSHSRSKDLIDIRARVLNDFHKYLTFIDKNSRDFNFSEYYEDTPFSDAEIKIHKDTISGIGKIVKSMVGLI